MMRALPSGRAGQPLAPGLRASAQWRAHKRARWMASGRAGWQGLRVWTSAAVRLRGGRRGGARPVIQAVTPSVSVKPQPAFEHRYGLPIVREYAKYHEILRDVRTEKVKEIHWFTQEDEYEVEGPCLIEYKDGSIKQGHIPPSDLRIPFAMNAHNVKGTALRPVPAPEELDPPVPPSERMLEFVSKVLPIIGLIAVYAAVHYMAWLRGDMDDRRKIRQKEKEEARRLKEEISQEQREEEAETLAMMGWDAEDIMEELGRKGIEMDKGYVERLVKRSSAKLGEQEAQGQFATEEEVQKQLDGRKERLKKMAEDSEDPMDAAQSLLSLSTLKMRKARKPELDENEDKEVRRKMKQLGRKMDQRGMKLQYTEDDTVYFDDVAGIGNAKFEVMEVVDFFTSPDRFRQSGARIPRGVLLCGPPGCGKTLLARAVAGEAGANFLSVNASEFVEMFIGVGASRVRDLFQEARKAAPAIVFIDEIDAVGRIRGGAMGNDERDQTVNQLLSELDGFNSKDADIVVMAATNRRDVLDPALIRAGRFDRIIYVPLPDFNGRIEILQVYLKQHPTTGDIDLREIAFETQRFSGAGIANLVNAAAIMAGKANSGTIRHKDLLAALAYERLGPDRQPYEGARQKRLAVQEAATCLVATLMPAIEPVVHVTIIPREKYPMGQTVLKVNEQRELTQQFTQRYLEEQLLMVLAARAAEELEFGPDEMSTINQRRLVMARRIVQKLMVSSAIDPPEGVGNRTLSNPRRYGRVLKQVVLPRVTTQTYENVEAAMEKRLNAAYAEVKEMLERNRKALTALIDSLVENNQLTGEQVREIIDRHAAKSDLRRRREQAAEFL